MADLKGLLERMVGSVVDNPGAVSIREVSGESITIYEVGVDKGDLGKVIGRKGRNIQAIRDVLTAAAKGRKKVRVDVVKT